MRSRVPFAPPFVSDFPQGEDAREGDVVYYVRDRRIYVFDGSGWTQVGTADIPDGSITAAKLATGAVTDSKVNNGTLNPSKLQAMPPFSVVCNPFGTLSLPTYAFIGTGLYFDGGVLKASGGGGGISDAPSDSQNYARRNNAWTVIDWASLAGKPATFAPSAHTHPWADITSRPTTLAGYGITDAAPISHVGSSGTAHAQATTSVDGFLSAADKTKLDAVPATAGRRSIVVTLRTEASAGLSVGTEFTVVVPYNLTLSVTDSWVMAANSSASAVVDVRRSTVASPTVFSSVAAASKPTLSASAYSTGAMTGWSTSLLAGEQVRFVVESASGVNEVRIMIPARIS